MKSSLNSDNGVVYDILAIYPFNTVRALKRHKKHPVAIDTYTVVDPLKKRDSPRVKGRGRYEDAARAAPCTNRTVKSAHVALVYNSVAVFSLHHYPLLKS